MSGYENSAACKMVATQCAICARPLVDAKSVEIGIGPVCRKKYNYLYINDLSEAARVEANKLIYQVASEQKGAHVVEACERLFELGFAQVVQAILKRIATVKIALTDQSHPHGAGRYAVKFPYCEQDAFNAIRNVPGCRWDKANKLNTYPAKSKVALFQTMQAHFAGETAIGPKGPFIIATSKPTAMKVAS